MEFCVKFKFKSPEQILKSIQKDCSEINRYALQKFIRQTFSESFGYFFTFLSNLSYRYVRSPSNRLGSSSRCRGVEIQSDWQVTVGKFCSKSRREASPEVNSHTKRQSLPQGKDLMKTSNRLALKTVKNLRRNYTSENWDFFFNFFYLVLFTPIGRFYI